MLLSDHGAEVVRVEPVSGDPERGMPAFAMWRRGQKSVALDLRRPADREQAATLAAGADIVLQNWRPGVDGRVGLDYAALSARNPGLIYCAITGFGARGPYAGVQGYEGIVGARAGRYATREPRFGLNGRTGPRFMASPHASYAAAHAALQGILAALYVRLRHGVGQKVETSLVQALSAFDVWDGAMECVAEKFPDAFTVAPAIGAGGVPLSPYFFRLLVAPAKDGRWFQFANVMPHHWHAFLKALDLEHTRSVPEFADSPNFHTEEASMRFWRLLLDRLREKTSAEWEAIFVRDDDIAFDLFRTTDDARHHAQMRINGHVIDVVDPALGPMQQIGPQVTLHGTPARIRAGAPRIGEHQEVLQAPPRASPLPPLRDPAELPAHPLQGVTVLELGTFFAAPYGVTLLGELGARIIKLEVLDGDPLRHGLPLPETGAFTGLAGKQSVAVDLRTPEGQAIAHALARKSDMAMCSFRPGAAARQRVDFDSLRALNPALVYHHGLAYGVQGPFVRHPLYGPTPPAVAGETLYQAGEGFLPAADAPVDIDRIRDVAIKIRQLNPGYGDPIAATAVATAMLMGLIARERFGIGQESMTTMIGSCAYLMSDDFVWYEGKPARPLPDADLYGLGPLYRIYRASDGWVFLAVTNEREWRGLCAAMQAARAGDFGADPRFAGPDLRAANGAALADALASAFAGRTCADWEERMRAADVACVWVNERPHSWFCTHDPIMAENGYLGEMDHFAYGTVPRHGLTVTLSRTPGRMDTVPPCGAHTEAVLREIGCDEARIADLRARGIVGIA